MIYNGREGALKVLARLARRNGGDKFETEAKVRTILSDVQSRGDTALLDYALRFEKTDYQETPLRVLEKEIDDAYGQCSQKQIDVVRLACKRLQTYHQAQVETGYCLENPGQKLMQIVRPLRCVGVYAPGGTASYPSSVLMNAIPAKVAGVSEILLATPAKHGKIAPLILVAAREAGVTGIFRMGGAQAIAAFAYGTETVPKVDKITGPGNSYVACAKRMVFGTVGIDSIAGPSEVVVLADDSADARFVASDMIAQAEHDASAAAICVTTSPVLAKCVETEIHKQIETSERTDIIRTSLKEYGAIVVLDSMDECLDFINGISPEHLECITSLGDAILPKIQNAGGIFIGPYTPEALGDYVAGSNHVLPTNGTARFASPLGVYDFVKRMSVLEFDRDALFSLSEAIQTLSDAEGLFAHGRSAAVRFKEEKR